MNSGVKYRVRIGKEKFLSEEFLLNTGGAQGTKLSPNNALVVLKETNRISVYFYEDHAIGGIEDKAYGIFFADDSSGVFVFKKGTNFQLIQNTITEFMRIFESKSLEFGLKLNVDKTVILTNNE